MHASRQPQRLEPDRRGLQQAQRIDVVGARRRTPHRAPVQAAPREPAARVPGHQLADHRLRRHRLTDPHGGPDRLVAGAQTAGMGQRHHRPSGQQPGEHHRRGPGGVHRLAGAPGQVHAAVPGIPVRRRGVESSHNRRAAVATANPAGRRLAAAGQR